jgi:hypothetical protein
MYNCYYISLQNTKETELEETGCTRLHSVWTLLWNAYGTVLTQTVSNERIGKGHPITDQGPKGVVEV